MTYKIEGPKVFSDKDIKAEVQFAASELKHQLAPRYEKENYRKRETLGSIMADYHSYLDEGKPEQQ